MNNECKKFIDELNKLQPTDDEFSIDELYELVELLEDNEEYPEAYFGDPGPLVHFIESYYDRILEFLIPSLQKIPTLLTLWMLNRNLNAKLEDNVRTQLLEVLKDSISHPKATEIVRNEAKRFLKFQMEKG